MAARVRTDGATIAAKLVLPRDAADRLRAVNTKRRGARHWPTVAHEPDPVRGCSFPSGQARDRTGPSRGRRLRRSRLPVRPARRGSVPDRQASSLGDYGLLVGASGSVPSSTRSTTTGFWCASCASLTELTCTADAITDPQPSDGSRVLMWHVPPRIPS